MHLKRSTKILVMAGVAALALSAFGAASASASIVAAKFSSTSLKLTTTGITVKRSNTEPKGCTASPSAIEGSGQSGVILVGNQPGGETKFSCPNGTSLTMVLYGEAKYDTVAESYFLQMKPNPGGYSLTSPWGGYFQNVAYNGSWANGSGTTASTATFSNPTIGYTFASAPISIEGTFNVTTPTGGLVTLSH